MFGFEIVYPLGAALVLAALAYGVLRTRGRTRAEKQRTEEATRREYRAEDADRSGL